MPGIKRSCMKNAIIVFFGIIMLGIVGFFLYSRKTTAPSDKITVVTTLFPMYDFAKQIGGDNVSVSLLLPPGVEPHSFEPKPSDVAKINSADIFVYTGEFMEPWAHDILESVNKTVTVVDASSGISLMKEEEDEHEEDHEEGDPHDHHGVDPHIWLDFDNAKIMAANIAGALEKADPQHAQDYQQRLKEYQENLDALDAKYKQTLATCKTNMIVYGGHYAFGYLAKRYGLSYVSAQGLSPDAEPSASDLIELVEQIKKNGVTAVFYEELSSPKIAETIARETNAALFLLNGTHNLAKEDFEKGVSYMSLMEQNLENLKKGLQCE